MGLTNRSNSLDYVIKTLFTQACSITYFNLSYLKVYIFDRSNSFCELSLPTRCSSINIWFKIDVVQAPFIDISIIEIQCSFSTEYITLILNDHVVQDYTTSHYLLHFLCGPMTTRFFDNTKSGLENSKSSFYILSAAFLLFGIPLSCFSLWVQNCFGKQSLRWVYPIH